MKAEAASALVESALAAGRKALSEHESKQLLSSYGIPVTRERPARGLEEAVSAAEDLGYPVVLKANSAGLLHKSEHGAVELCLGDAQAVRGAYRRLMHIKSYSVDEVLVQEMVPGNRELALGLIRDPQFGPCVMLGMGGVAAEILQDAVFRTAPISQAEAVEMARELRHARILDAFRGQARTDLDVLTGSLVALSRLGVELDRVLEVDVNPMIITPEGRLVAADALVALAASPLVGPV
ncbi:MAG: acetate--CoA ligase family protein [Desulfobacteraceae bacterium]